MHVLASHSSTHCCANNDQDHDGCHKEEGLHFHAEDDARRAVIVAVCMLAGVVMAVEDGLLDDGKFVRMRVDGIVILESGRRGDLGSIVILVECREARR